MNSRPAGVLYARTIDGSTLPVIDVTHPSFLLTPSEAELASACDQFVRESKSRQKRSSIVQRLLLSVFLRRSRIGRGLLAASGTFLTGMNTYILKLGAENLGSDANALDRRIAGSFPALATRLRLQDLAHLLADGLSRTMASSVDRPICLINIAGGPAADSWNALILLQARYRDRLAGRHIVIAVMDLDEEGPAFGGNALAALGAPGAPLRGLRIEFRHVKYDWHDTATLARTLDALRAREAVCAISSEGGLFEYGSDQEIIANLATLRAGTDAEAFCVGSVTRDNEPTRLAQALGKAVTRPRTIDAFRHLVGQAGWLVDRTVERPFSYNVQMSRAR